MTVEAETQKPEKKNLKPRILIWVLGLTCGVQEPQHPPSPGVDPGGEVVGVYWCRH